MSLTELILQSKIPVKELSDQDSITLKKVLLEIYIDVAKVCKDNNLNCILAGGSCLGAIRHKGFIPWDDDFDLVMFRDEYDKLPELLERAFPGKYNCIFPGSSKRSELGFYKIELRGTKLVTVYDTDNDAGIAIDIFPIETVPNNRLHRWLHGVKVLFLLYIAICVKLFKKNSMADKIISKTLHGKFKLGIRKLIGFLFSWHTYQIWYMKADKACSKKYNSNLTAIPTGRGHYYGEMHDKAVYLPTKNATFENIPVELPGNYDRYLSAIYGDYMQLPPLEKRERHFIVEIDFGKTKSN